MGFWKGRQRVLFRCVYLCRDVFRPDNKERKSQIGERGRRAQSQEQSKGRKERRCPRFGRDTESIDVLQGESRRLKVGNLSGKTKGKLLDEVGSG